MIILGLTLAGIAALLHVYIFYLESIVWTSKKARATFGLTASQADATKEMAFNQGFYNLFLAIITGIGIILSLTGSPGPGAALVIAGIGSMTAAALVLLLSSPDKRGAALKQGVIPCIGTVTFAIGLLL